MSDATGTAFDELARVQRVVPSLAIGDTAIVAPLIDALTAGGVRCIEVLLRDAEAVDHIRWIAAHHPDVHVGAGNLVDPTQWDAIEAAGARFVASPCATPALYARAADSALPWLPGVQTPGEIANALAAGYRTLRFFPAAPAGGAPALAVLAPVFPEARFSPAGGIDAGTCRDYLALPSVTWIAGGWLTPATLVATGQWHVIRERVRLTCGGAADTAFFEAPAAPR
jgi:2-dehydro-3-deoxyphosphogluconate aldolase/(4S)-4-hydroxy-2-oxoglutarate aldolase